MNILVRTDASAEIGMGHVMRSLALAQAWQDLGGQVTFAMATGSQPVRQRLMSESIDLLNVKEVPGSRQDAHATASAAKKLDATWVVLDGYVFEAEFQRVVKDSQLRLLVIDDYGHSNHYWADIIVNQDFAAFQIPYGNRETYSRLLLGPRYALLRREFTNWGHKTLEIPEVAGKVLVTIGGSDKENLTSKVLKALEKADVSGLDVVAVIGGANPHYKELLLAAADSSVPVRLEPNPVNMPELMAWADVATSAGGGTCAELLFMGVPSLVIIVADNQEQNVAALDSAGAVISLGQHELLSVEAITAALAGLCQDSNKRREMSRKGRSLLDGRGALRVAEVMNDSTVKERKG
ncbi:MAG: UDP-2,4-diacetamido-2,4,6-trideoxy-beta-L-altropyranose hydrolase [Desulfomonile tiedjei]|nr:UDP-2,4-diacetamido-2,4,6-trideoxy-beta-L-altropyranose hydrolase [Desulfomonile tiedjei]